MVKRNIVRSDFSKNVLTLISGTTIAQAISIGISPILSRIYSPSEFGIYGTFSSVVGLICLFGGARYEGAILLPKEDNEAANILALSLFFNVLISLISFLIVFSLSFIINTEIVQSETFKWFYLIPVFIFFISIVQSLNCWYNRKKLYRKIVNYRIANSAINNFSALTLGYIKISVNGLVFSYFIANFIAIFVFFIQLKKDYAEFKNFISIKEMKRLAKKYKHFPYVNSVQALSDAFQINGVIYFVSYFFEKIFVGIYSFAMRVLLVPMNFAGAAISQVFYQHATETYNNNGNLSQLMKNTVFKSLLIAIPALLMLMLYGPQLFSFVFGEKWLEAGVYARILAPWIMLDFIRAPLSQIPIIIGKQNRLLYFSIISNLIIFSIMLYTGVVTHDLKAGFLVLAVLESVYTIGIITWIFKIVKQPNLHI